MLKGQTKHKLNTLITLMASPQIEKIKWENENILVIVFFQMSNGGMEKQKKRSIE